MKRLDEIIKKEIKKVINESLTSVLYHFTDLNSFLKIAESDDLILSRTKAYSEANNEMDSNDINSAINKGYKYYFSFTRSPNNHQGFSQWFGKNPNMSDFKEDDVSFKGMVRIEFDGDKLNNTFKGKPVDFFTRAFRQADEKKKKEYKDIDNIVIPKDNKNTSSKEVQLNTPNLNNIKKTKVNPNPFFVQNEDRLFSNQRIIPNISRFITRVDIKVYDKDDYYQVFDIVNRTILGQEGKIHLYKKFEDMNTINKDNYFRIKDDLKSTSFKI